MEFINENHQKSVEQLKAGDFALALEFINAALEQVKSHPVLLAERATIYMYMKRKDDAFEDLDLAIYLQPENPYRYSSRAYVKDFFGDVAGAIEDYEKCLELDPEDLIAHNNLGLLIEKQGNMKKAQRHFQSADDLLAKNPDWQNRIPKEDENDTTEKSLSSSSQSATPEVKPTPSNSENTISVAKNVFTKKSVFKEFVQFVFNGFKLKNK
jgi:tetratricopeptide (TPR) repeat protein